jgi:hypothetical protein
MLPAFLPAIGSDRYLTPTEVERASQPHPHIAAAWDVYTQFFQGFTGASLDPMFHRLAHPAVNLGSVHVEADTTVLVAGTGPSLRANIDAIRRAQGHLRVFTSPRGAEALLSHGIVPDLVIVEHQTALDAHHSARHVTDAMSAIAGCPLIAADWRTPAALLAGVHFSSLFVPASLPTWGLWPATAVAMAAAAGAERVALVGIDLGTAERPDPAHAPLGALLGLIARVSPIVALDCGEGGARKSGWILASVDEVAGKPLPGRCEVSTHRAPSIAERREHGAQALQDIEPIASRALVLLSRALAARGRRHPGPVAPLEDAVTEMMAWRKDAAVRTILQESLGLSFLPRLWRIGIDPSLGHALWRPVALAMHELVQQADTLANLTAGRDAEETGADRHPERSRAVHAERSRGAA